MMIKCIFSIIEIIICYTFFSAFLMTAYIHKVKVSLYFIAIAMIGTIISEFYFHNIVNIIKSLAAVSLIAVPLYNGNKTKKLLLIMLYMTFSLICEFLVAVVLFQISDFNKILTEQIDSLNMILTIILFMKMIIVLWLKMKRDKKDLLGNNTLYMLQVIIPTLSIIFLLTYINTQRVIIDFLHFYFLIGMLTIINITQYIIFGKVEQLYIVEYENDMLEHRLDYMSEYLDTVEKHMQKIKIIKHDMKNHLLLLEGYIKKEPEKAIKEIHKLSKELNDSDVHMFTDNAGINALLNMKYNLAIKENIETSFNILIPKRLSKIDSKDVASILGNLLDNAIESCQKIKKGNKMLCLDIYVYNKCVIISMKNSTNGQISDLSTHKNNREWHGIGMKSIQTVINRYSGSYEWSCKNNIFEIELNMWDG